MILSHRHQLIFLHCRKAAGSSVTVSLARLLGPRDLQIGCVQDAARFGIYPPWLSGLQALWPPQARAWRELVRRRSLAAWLDAQIKAHHSASLGPKPQHASAHAVSRAFPQPWSRYRRFCVVRNPWAKTLSDYYWRVRGLQDPPSFEAYLFAWRDGDSLGGIVPSNPSNWTTYSLEGRVAVDHVLRFEHLHADLTQLMQRLQIPWDGWLPHAKASGSTDPLAYRSAYSPAMAQLVGDLSGPEIAAHGYGF